MPFPLNRTKIKVGPTGFLMSSQDDLHFFFQHDKPQFNAG